MNDRVVWGGPSKKTLTKGNNLKKVMFHIDAKQVPPKDGYSPIELFQVEIHPLRIRLTETMYRIIWEYLFPEKEQDSHQRQEVWKVSNTAGLKRRKKGSSTNEAMGHLTKHSESSSESSVFTFPNSSFTDSSYATKVRRTASFDRMWEGFVAESVANEQLVLEVQSLGVSASKTCLELRDDTARNKSKDSGELGKSARSSQQEKKVVKQNDEKRPRRIREFHNIMISQVYCRDGKMANQELKELIYKLNEELRVLAAVSELPTNHTHHHSFPSSMEEDVFFESAIRVCNIWVQLREVKKKRDEIDHRPKMADESMWRIQSTICWFTEFVRNYVTWLRSASFFGETASSIIVFHQHWRKTDFLWCDKVFQRVCTTTSIHHKERQPLCYHTGQKIP